MNNFNRGGRGMSFSLEPREAQTFFLDKESMQRNQGVECSPKFRTSRLNLKNSLRSDSLRFHTSPDSKFLTAVHPKAVLTQRFKPTALLMVFCVLFSSLMVSPVYGQEAKGLTQIVLRGVVSSLQDGKPIEGASITVDKKHARTDKEGRFTIPVDQPTGVITIKHIGYKEQRVAYENTSTTLIIALQTSEKQIDEVEVVSTGYQKIPKERVVGAFDNYGEQLLQSQVQPSILDRIEGNSTILFDRRNSSNTKLQIRGMYSLMSGLEKPLIILNDFPYEGDIDYINPDDVDNITVLKDAAAASIWGVRAGNGVIVITTKNGKNIDSKRIEGNSVISVMQRPYLMDRPILGAAEHMEFETDLYHRGFYTQQINNMLHPPLPSVVEILNNRTLGKISAADSAAAFDALKRSDIRQDLLTHFYRKAVTQQYNVAISSAGSIGSARMSLGYSRIRENLIGDQSSRLVARWNQDVHLGSTTILNLGSSFSKISHANNSLGEFAAGNWRTNTGQLLPIYQSLIDQEGNPQQIYRRFRGSYLESLKGQGLLDWANYPLEELHRQDRNVNGQHFMADLGLTQKLGNELNLSLKYQFQQEMNKNESYHSLESYYARDLINNYTNLKALNPKDIYPIPIAGILDFGSSDVKTHHIRGQIDYTKKWAGIHDVRSMAGAEIRMADQEGRTGRFYGHDANAMTRSVDFLTRYPTYQGSQLNVPFLDEMADTDQRFVSYYANLTYNLLDRYTLFSSGRIDAANLFGMNCV